MRSWSSRVRRARKSFRSGHAFCARRPLGLSRARSCWTRLASWTPKRLGVDRLLREEQRVHPDPADVRLPVQMRAADEAGLAHEADEIADSDGLPLSDRDAVKVVVAAEDSGAVI